MARPSSTQPLIPSIFERLIDLNPNASTEKDKSRTLILKELRESVRRDLEKLMNTRMPCNELPEDLEQLRLSTINYGIPDFSGNKLVSDREKEQYRKQIETIITFFEPRFKSVHVELNQGENKQDRSLRFRIDALLNVQPAVKPIAFDSRMEPITQNFKIRDLDSD